MGGSRGVDSTLFLSGMTVLYWPISKCQSPCKCPPLTVVIVWFDVVLCVATCKLLRVNTPPPIFGK